MTLSVANMEIKFKMVGGPAPDAEFSVCFNADGTCTHSARPDGTYSVAGLTVTTCDEEETLLTFPKAAIEVGDVFEATGDLRFAVIACTPIEI